MRTFNTLGILTSGHFAATVLLQAFTYASGMTRFDSGQPAGPIERTASDVLAVLSFPLLRAVFRDRGPVPWYLDGLMGYIPFALNSLLWASALLGCARPVQTLSRARDRACRLVTGVPLLVSGVSCGFSHRSPG
jgi:hypothetical protein